MSDFRPMLAASEIPPATDLRFPLYASVKLDGIRCPMINGVAMSRKLIPLPNLNFQAWAKRWQHLLDGLDGEVLVGDPTHETAFNNTQRGIMTIPGEPDFHLFVFEVHNRPAVRAKDRYEWLLGWYHQLPPELQRRITVLEQRLIRNVEELQAFMDHALDSGYEGLILKDPRGLYKYGRSSIREGTLLKWKVFMDSEAEILEVIEGQANINPLTVDAVGQAKRSLSKAGMVKNGTLGGFLVRSPQFGEFRVSPGKLTAAEGQHIYNNREKYIGKWLTFKYQPYGGYSLPRFPGWKGFRDNIDFE